MRRVAWVRGLQSEEAGWSSCTWCCTRLVRLTASVLLVLTWWSRLTLSWGWCGRWLVQSRTHHRSTVVCHLQWLCAPGWTSSWCGPSYSSSVSRGAQTIPNCPICRLSQMTRGPSVCLTDLAWVSPSSVRRPAATPDKSFCLFFLSRKLMSFIQIQQAKEWCLLFWSFWQWQASRRSHPFWLWFIDMHVFNVRFSI